MSTSTRFALARQRHERAVAGRARMAGEGIRPRHRRGTGTRRAAVRVVRRAGKFRRRASWPCIAFDADNTLAVGRSAPFSGNYPSLTRNASAGAFVRARSLGTARPQAGRPSVVEAGAADKTATQPANGEFFRVEGGEIHEVAVGPVHAGIIEPGHFRFQCNGEEVLHLEIALGYQHRGVEEALAGGPHRATMSQMETVAGDTTIGHATAHATVLESLAGTEAPLRAQWLRAHRARTGTARQSHRRPRRAGRRRGVSAHVLRVRKNPRRFSESHRADLRQPFRPRSRPARRLQT